MMTQFDTTGIEKKKNTPQKKLRVNQINSKSIVEDGIENSQV